MLRTIGQGAAHYGVPGGTSAYLDGVLASTVFDLDATIAASYPGSGTTWANLAATPADGQSPSAYDFLLGDGVTGTTYPIFTGSTDDPAALWRLEGSDYFRIKSGANTSFLDNLHKTTGGQDFWMAVTFKRDDTTWASGYLFSTLSVTGTFTGIDLLIASTETLSLYQRNNSTSNIATIPVGALATTTPNIAILSHNHSTNTTRYWANSGTGADLAHTFGTTTAAAAQPATIGVNGNLTSNFVAETSLYSFAMGNEYLDDAKAAAIIPFLHGYIEGMANNPQLPVNRDWRNLFEPPFPVCREVGGCDLGQCQLVQGLPQEGIKDIGLHLSPALFGYYLVPVALQNVLYTQGVQNLH